MKGGTVDYIPNRHDIIKTFIFQIFSSVTKAKGANKKNIHVIFLKKERLITRTSKLLDESMFSLWS